MTVTDVADGCAASGLMIKGDSIFSINGTPITDEVQGRALARAAVGKVTFSILRGDQFVTIVADKPEATTRLGVTFKDKKRLHAVKLAAAVATAEVEEVESFEDIYLEGPPRAPYNQWPGLFDCFSSGNSMCCYGTCCTPCLAGQMYSHLFETRGKPGCCMNQCLIYTLGSIGAYMLLLLPGIVAMDNPQQAQPGWAGITDALAEIMLFLVSAMVCWTLMKARGASLAARLSLLIQLAPRSGVSVECGSSVD